MWLEKLGVRKVINAWGTVTLIGGTTVSPEAIDAMREASKVYMDMKDLHKKAGDYIAKLVGGEAACVTSGATAGLILATAACMTGGNLEKILSLPKVPSNKNGLLVQNVHHNAFLSSLRTAGADVRFFGTEKETTASDFEKAIDDTLAGVMYFVFDPQPGVLPLGEVVRIAHKHNLPVIVDAAGELPPPENLQNFTRTGADIVVFSGGKGLGGPSDTGLVLGRKDLIETIIRLQYYEYVGIDTIALLGRSMKVSKEDILALTAAVSQYVKADHLSELKHWEGKVDYMIAELSRSKKLPPPQKVYPKYGHSVRPLVIPRVALDFNKVSWTNAAEMSDRLKKLDDPIYVYVKENILYLNPQCLQDDEEKIVAAQLLKLAD